MFHARIVRTAFVCFLTVALPALAYEKPVHMRMTEKAFDRSGISFERHLGTSRNRVLFNKSLRTWMAQGAFDEDRIVPDARSLNHFFDTMNGRALKIFIPPNPFVPLVGCVEVGARADAWATTVTSGVSGNSYSIPRARELYAFALTGPNPGTRDVYLKELFLALGHDVHLVQDMAQPEHTRNDQHLPVSNFVFDNGTAASIWEEWGLANLTNPATSLISFDGYPSVTLPDYASYFHTNHTANGRPAGKGMGDFSANNFVTQDTNYHDEDPAPLCGLIPNLAKCLYHTEPRIGEAAHRVEHDQHEAITILIDNHPVQATVIVDEDVFTSFPLDRYAGIQETDPFHTYLSSIDLETRREGCDRLYSLGDGSYLSRASMLVPRAVGYSAGLLDRFFRGDLDASWTPQPGGTYTLKLTNRSAEPLGPDAGIAAIYRAAPPYFGRTNSDDTEIIVSGELSDLVPGFTGLAPGQSTTFDVGQIPGLHPGDSLGRFEKRIVVTGTLGTEADAVIGLVQPGYGPGLTFEVTWTDDIFLAAQIFDQQFPPGSNVYTQACWQPLYGGLPCQNYPSVPNSRVVEETTGVLAINVNPVLASASYEWKANMSVPYPVQIRATLYRDGQVVFSQPYVIPGCIPVGTYCHSPISLGFFP